MSKQCKSAFVDYKNPLLRFPPRCILKEVVVYGAMSISQMGLVKIGCTDNIIQRAISLRKKHHFLWKMVPLFVVKENKFQEEREIHHKFRKYRVKGEWFKVEGKLKKFLDGAYVKNKNSTVFFALSVNSKIMLLKEKGAL